MRIFLLTGLLGLVLAPSCFAQVSLPANPGKFKTRNLGSSSSGGAFVTPVPKEDPNVRYVTHIILYDDRLWTNTEGKPLQAKLIAFEDLVATAPKGSTAPVMPAPPP